MKSTMLVIVIAMFVSAIYSMQNNSLVFVKFLSGVWQFPQGAWEVFIFYVGVFIMFILSLFADFGTKRKYKQQIKELKFQLHEAEEKKKALMAVSSISEKDVADKLADCSYLSACPVDSHKGNSDESVNMEQLSW